MKNVPILYGIIVILAALLFFSYSGVNNKGFDLKPTAEILKKLDANSAHGAVLFNTNGDITLIDVKGNPATTCRFPDQKGKDKVCRGFDGGKVLNFQSIGLLKTEGSICFSFVGSSGAIKQICY